MRLVYQIPLTTYLLTTTAYCTTFFDFYGLANDFPGKEAASNLKSIEEKATCLETAFAQSVKTKIVDNLIVQRFIPYVQMYEFEALLFSDCSKFASGVGHSNISAKIQAVRDGFKTPEEINNSPQTAPSKLVEKLIPKYTKVIMGSQGAKAIGLSKIRSECKLFDAWLKKLETLKAI